MTQGKRQWVVRLTASAETDFEGILRWTVEHFGEAQAQGYADTLSTALQSLADGPRAIGATARSYIAKGLYTLHVAHRGRKGRHFVMFRLADEKDRNAIEVLRLLHDAMDLPRHFFRKDEPD